MRRSILMVVLMACGGEVDAEVDEQDSEFDRLVADCEATCVHQSAHDSCDAEALDALCVPFCSSAVRFADEACYAELSDMYACYQAVSWVCDGSWTVNDLAMPVPVGDDSACDAEDDAYAACEG